MDRKLEDFWEKVDENNLPKTLTGMMVSARDDMGYKRVVHNVAWDEHIQSWIWGCGDGSCSLFEDTFPGLHITHFMRYPEPAED